jgi:hypothetical protein
VPASADDARARAVELLSLDYYYERFRDRVEGLTDDEYLWEPVPGCLSVTGARGKVEREGPVPFTTIAWRICHIGDTLREERNWRWLAREPGRLDADIVHPRRADGALAYVDDAWAAWQSLVASLTIDELWEPIGPIGGAYADSERLAFVLHIMDELIHHAAEVGVLRDLYAARGLPTGQPGGAEA